MTNYLAAARTSKRMSQQRLADLIGTTVKAISEIEAGRAGFATIETRTRILQALGIPLSRYRTVFPELPFEPRDVPMPTSDEVCRRIENRRHEENRRALAASRRSRLTREQDAVRSRRRK